MKKVRLDLPAAAEERREEAMAEIRRRRRPEGEGEEAKEERGEIKREMWTVRDNRESE